MQKRNQGSFWHHSNNTPDENKSHIASYTSDGPKNSKKQLGFREIPGVLFYIRVTSRVHEIKEMDSNEHSALPPVYITE
jgi:hypothetical protein